MAFFSEIGKKITQTSQDVVQKTKDTAETLKLSGMISDEEKRIEILYREIGKAYFEKFADDSEALFPEQMSAIKEAMAKKEDYASQIQKLKGAVTCRHCGRDVSPENPFCSFCGGKIVLVDQPNEVPVCPACGKAVEKDAKFCTGCGTNLT